MFSFQIRPDNRNNRKEFGNKLLLVALFLVCRRLMSRYYSWYSITERKAISERKGESRLETPKDRKTPANKTIGRSLVVTQAARTKGEGDEGEQFTELLGLSIDELRSKVQLRLSELIEYLISLLIPPRLPPSWWPRPLGAPLVSLLLVNRPFLTRFRRCLRAPIFFKGSDLGHPFIDTLDPSLYSTRTICDNLCD